jgi:L-lactate dehydrogenase complex protein LldG
MSDARSRILAALRAGRPAAIPPAAGRAPTAAAATDRASLVQCFRTRLEAVRAEVHVAEAQGWPALVHRLARERGVARLLFGADGPLADALRRQIADDGPPALVPYADPIEGWKDELFHGIDAGITASLGGVADTGSVILWPGPAEPRLMSLVPPVHFVVVEAAQLHATLDDAMAAQRWADGMPTNALLISGPSKSADIEQTLAYGVHGPKAFVVILVDS